jgi:hypothetical protein
MINPNEEKLLKKVERLQMTNFEDYLKLKVRNRVSKLEKATPETLVALQGEIKGIREVLSDCNYLIRGASVNKKGIKSK